MKTSLTIKEAVLSVLTEAERSMTADEIYYTIIARRLYTFGAQNPINVVRTTIESACDNSSYSKEHRDANPCFHFEKNAGGKRVYSLLRSTKSKNSKMECSVKKDLTINNLNLIIWDSKIEQDFKKWLENEDYAQKTVENYCRSVAQVFRYYAAFAGKAITSSETAQEAVRTLIKLLNKNDGFIEANTTRHNQFTAALSAFERFHKSDCQINESPKPVKASTSSLGDIVDLEDGKAGLRKILEAHFQTLYGYSNIGIVWNAAQDNLVMFLNDNALNTSEELW